MVTLNPADAHYECVALTRQTDYYDGLLADIPQSVERGLDAGCGSGRFTLRLSDRAVFMVGLDQSSELIHTAARLQREQKRENVAWVVGDIERLPFRDKAFDLVISTNALRLTHLPRALQGLGHLVMPGGQMAIQDLTSKAGRLGPLPISHLSNIIFLAPRYLRIFGPIMALRIIAFRLSPKEFRRAYSINRLTNSGLAQIYRRLLPGCVVKLNRWTYCAHWRKPWNAMR